MKTHNELIAEFMGFKFHSDRESGNIRIYDVPDGKDLEYKAFKLSHLKFQFDTSWDWLMPVVEKIGNIGTESTYPIGHPLFGIAGKVLAGVDCSIFSKRENVYIRVVEFIKWYNSQTP